jgi:hypothetical protein
VVRDRNYNEALVGFVAEDRKNHSYSAGKSSLCALFGAAAGCHVG